MRSNRALQTEAFRVATRNARNLRDVLELCESDVRIGNSCSFVPEVWKELIERFFGNVLVLQRGDLQSGADWYDFARSLATGVEYKYCLGFDANNIWDTRPIPFASINEGIDNPDVRIFQIQGMLPSRGSTGYLVHCELNGDKVYGEVADFFLDVDPAVAARHAARLVADWYVDKMHRMDRRGFPHRSELRIDGGAVIPLDDFPDVTFFADTVRASLDQGNRDGRWEQMWDILIAGELAQQAERVLDWWIVPITF